MMNKKNSSHVMKMKTLFDKCEKQPDSFSKSTCTPKKSANQATLSNSEIKQRILVFEKNEKFKFFNIFENNNSSCQEMKIAEKNIKNENQSIIENKMINKDINKSQKNTESKKEISFAKEQEKSRSMAVSFFERNKFSQDYFVNIFNVVGTKKTEKNWKDQKTDYKQPQKMKSKMFAEDSQTKKEIKNNLSKNNQKISTDDLQSNKEFFSNLSKSNQKITTDDLQSNKEFFSNLSKSNKKITTDDLQSNREIITNLSKSNQKITTDDLQTKKEIITNLSKSNQKITTDDLQSNREIITNLSKSNQKITTDDLQSNKEFFSNLSKSNKKITTDDLQSNREIITNLSKISTKTSTGNFQAQKEITTNINLKNKNTTCQILKAKSIFDNKKPTNSIRRHSLGSLRELNSQYIRKTSKNDSTSYFPKTIIIRKNSSQENKKLLPRNTIKQQKQTSIMKTSSFYIMKNNSTQIKESNSNNKSLIFQNQATNTDNSKNVNVQIARKNSSNKKSEDFMAEILMLAEKNTSNIKNSIVKENKIPQRLKDGKQFIDTLKDSKQFIDTLEDGKQFIVESKANFELSNDKKQVTSISKPILHSLNDTKDLIATTKAITTAPQDNKRSLDTTKPILTSLNDSKDLIATTKAISTAPQDKKQILDTTKPILTSLNDKKQILDATKAVSTPFQNAIQATNVSKPILTPLQDNKQIIKTSKAILIPSNDIKNTIIAPKVISQPLSSTRSRTETGKVIPQPSYYTKTVFSSCNTKQEIENAVNNSHGSISSKTPTNSYIWMFKSKYSHGTQFMLNKNTSFNLILMNLFNRPNTSMPNILSNLRRFSDSMLPQNVNCQFNTLTDIKICKKLCNTNVSENSIAIPEAIIFSKRRNSNQTNTNICLYKANCEKNRQLFYMWIVYVLFLKNKFSSEKQLYSQKQSNKSPFLDLQTVIIEYIQDFEHKLNVEESNLPLDNTFLIKFIERFHELKTTKTINTDSNYSENQYLANIKKEILENLYSESKQKTTENIHCQQMLNSSNKQFRQSKHKGKVHCLSDLNSNSNQTNILNHENLTKTCYNGFNLPSTKSSNNSVLKLKDFYENHNFYSGEKRHTKELSILKTLENNPFYKSDVKKIIIPDSDNKSTNVCIELKNKSEKETIDNQRKNFENNANYKIRGDIGNPETIINNKIIDSTISFSEQSSKKFKLTSEITKMDKKYFQKYPALVNLIKSELAYFEKYDLDVENIFIDKKSIVQQKAADILKKVHHIPIKNLSEQEQDMFRKYCISKIKETNNNSSFLQKTLTLIKNFFNTEKKENSSKEIEINTEVYKIIDHIMEFGTETPGLFRICGTKNSFFDAPHQLQKGLINVKEFLKVNDIHDAASLLKGYVNNVLRGLFPLEVMPAIFNAEGMKEYKKVNCLYKIKKYIKHTLRPEDMYFLNRIFQLWEKIIQNGTETKMTAQGLAVCFAPTIFNCENCSDIRGLKGVADLLQSIFEEGNLTTIEWGLYKKFRNSKFLKKYKY